MTELRAGRSWRWFMVRLSGLSPDAAFWRQWRHQHDPSAAAAAGSPRVERGRMVEPTYVVDGDDDAAWAALARRAGWKRAPAAAGGVTDGDAAGR